MKSIAPGKGYLTGADEIVFLLEEVPRKLRKLFDASTAKFGLSRTQWRALGYIYRTPGLTQTELARHLEIERASVGHVIDQLEKAAFVERRAAVGNRRIWALHLLPKAITLLPSLRREADRIYDRVLSGLAKEQVSAFEKMLEIMSSNLED
ncbi:MarR family winged helix-turn-helix transcriptional regulator [Novosphingobium percolationis]|uniref:MarR family winged helix-turn-helix transcriptional regulator n=1 Tax=Novosphingobium percolationis TaxID=2871811 RepID=UPI001CD627D5|nr:MarR family transcriptional regulator [Novosphingobium percolationis]